MALQRNGEMGDSSGDADFMDAMRRLGATSSATACPDRDLPRLSRERFRTLLDHGVLREAASGTYYLYEHAVAPPMAFPAARRAPGGRRLVTLLIFWLAVILVPVIFMQISR